MDCATWSAIMDTLILLWLIVTWFIDRRTR